MATRMTARTAAMDQIAVSNPAVAKKCGTQQEPQPLYRVLRPGQRRNPAEQAVVFRRGQQLDRRF